MTHPSHQRAIYVAKTTSLAGLSGVFSSFHFASPCIPAIVERSTIIRGTSAGFPSECDCPKNLGLGTFGVCQPFVERCDVILSAHYTSIKVAVIISGEHCRYAHDYIQQTYDPSCWLGIVDDDRFLFTISVC